METPVIRERYKVTQVLLAQADYAALEAADIQSRQTETCLLNVYEGAYLKPYLSVFTALRRCAAFRGVFVEDGSLVAVFDRRTGPDIDQVFYRGARLGWEDRLHYAQLLFHLALSMTDDPPEVSCACMLSENLLVNTDEKTLRQNYLLRPLPAANQRELIFLLTDQLQKVLTPRFSSLVREREFVRDISAGGETSMVALYARWTQEKAGLTQDYEALYQRMAFSRFVRLVWMNITYGLRQLLGRKKG